MANLADFTEYDPTYEQNSYAFRGKIIAHFAMFEKTLDGLLAAEFSSTGEGRRKMQNVIFDRMTFESKRTAVKTLLLDRAKAEGFVPSKKKGNPYNQLIDDLSYLNALRNQFAHYPTVQATNKEEYGMAIGLLESRDNPNSKWFTSNQIDEIIEKISATQKELVRLTQKRAPN